MRLLAAFLTLFTFAACHAPLYPIKTAASEYKIEGIMSEGTAWASDKHAVVTAGHVCKNNSSGMVLYPRQGDHFPVTVIKQSDDPDLCLLSTDHDLSPLWLADRLPDYGEPVWYAGNANGDYADGVEPVFVGHWAGSNGSLGAVAIPGTHGASGAALTSARGVVGVIVQGDPNFPEVLYVEPLDHIKEFLSEGATDAE